MRKCLALLLIFLAITTRGAADVYAGAASVDITPPIGTPSAGYLNRKGPMEGVHDSLFANALVIKNENRCLVLCTVDNLGLTTEIIQEIVRKVRAHSFFSSCEIYIGSSHTHSGGGAFLNIPLIGPLLAGKYDSQITQFYIDKTAEAILMAGAALQPVKVGIGYGEAFLNYYRGKWPLNVDLDPAVSVIKFTDFQDKAIAVVFNYAMHPTVLDHTNKLFSADFVGPARDHLKTLLGDQIVPLYFNGAQGDLIPKLRDEKERNFAQSERIGKDLASVVADIWNGTPTQNDLDIAYFKQVYQFTPQPTPKGLRLPIKNYTSEINLLILNHVHAFITIPGELSTIYKTRFSEKSKFYGFSHFSVLGLVNDAHGYIILPESWRHQTQESELSFGGEHYGEEIEQKVSGLLELSLEKTCAKE